MDVPEYNKKVRLFTDIVTREKRYLSENKRLEILQFRWGIITGIVRTFRDINRIVHIKNSKQIYSEMIMYFTEKNYLAPEAKCGVYFIKGEIITRLIKVGQSSNVPARLYNLQIGSADKLRIEYVIPLEKNVLEIYEKKVHIWLDEYRHHGEWFDILDDDIVKLYACYSQEDLDVLMETDRMRSMGLGRKKGIDDSLEDDKDYSEEEVNDREREKIQENLLLTE